MSCGYKMLGLKSAVKNLVCEPAECGFLFGTYSVSVIMVFRLCLSHVSFVYLQNNYLDHYCFQFICCLLGLRITTSLEP